MGIPRAGLPSMAVIESATSARVSGGDTVETWEAVEVDRLVSVQPMTDKLRASLSGAIRDTDYLGFANIDADFSDWPTKPHRLAISAGPYTGDTFDVVAVENAAGRDHHWELGLKRA